MEIYKDYKKETESITYVLEVVRWCVRKILICIFIILFLACLTACGNDTWITAEISGYGKIKLPPNWESTVVNDFIYLSSNERGEIKEVLVQYRNDEKINERFADIEEFIWVQDENFSNSTCITKYKVRYSDASSVEMYALRFTGGDNYESTEFLCLDESISETVLKKIAQSYVME